MRACIILFLLCFELFAQTTELVPGTVTNITTTNVASTNVATAQNTENDDSKKDPNLPIYLGVGIGVPVLALVVFAVASPATFRQSCGRAFGSCFR